MIERYRLEKMGKVWSEKSKYEKWLSVELAVLYARAELKEIPTNIYKEIKKRASFDIKEIEKLEQTLHHDLIAFVQNVQGYLGDYGRYFHYGLTSYDVEDPALSIRMQSASDIIIEDIDTLINILKERAGEFKETVMVGRTHGVHAEPITFGFKLCLWMDEMERNLERIVRAKEEMRVGKISGACGTYPILSPEVERLALEILGLKCAPVSSQVLSRDRHSYYLSVLAVLASSLENFATQIRLMQQTERGEVREPFGKGQRGSSAMPHKQNPIISERICGLARVIRSYASSALENVALWDERDISHSSVERIILPDSTILVDYMLNKFIYLIENLEVDERRMRENLGLTGGLIFSQGVRLALIENGMPQDEAYTSVQSVAFLCSSGTSVPPLNFKEILLQNKRIMEFISPCELDVCFDNSKILKNISGILERCGVL